MPNPSPRHTAFCILVFCFSATTAFAAEPAPSAVQKVVGGLKNPCSVAVRPDGAADQYEVFVADAGSGKVVKFAANNPGKSVDVVSGFTIPQSNDGRGARTGIQSLLFLDHLRLLVTGTDDDEQPFFQLYELPESDTPLSSDQHKADVRLSAGKKHDANGIRTLPGIARTQPNEKFGDVLIVPSRADTGSDGLVVIPVRAGMLAEPVAVQLTNPGGDLAIDAVTAVKSGYIVLAGRAEKSDQSSVLAFVNPLDRSVVMQVPVELERIVALAYNPKTGNLYAANSAPSNKRNTGIYRIDASEKNGAPACKIQKIEKIESPTALAFAPSGTLYITTSDKGAVLRVNDVP